MEAHVQLASQNINKRVKSVLPTRQEQLQRLKDDEFDVLVIGGGATGSGCALDAATRGLKTGQIKRVFVKTNFLRFFFFYLNAINIILHALSSRLSRVG